MPLLFLVVNFSGLLDIIILGARLSFYHIINVYMYWFIGMYTCSGVSRRELSELLTTVLQRETLIQ